MATHSSIVGGSTADRLLNCPGSWQATMALPDFVNRTSEYAEEGTAMHAVMAALMQERLLVGHASDPRGLIGVKFHDRILTAAHVDTMIDPALAALEQLELTHGGGFSIVAVEVKVAFPGIPGAFGTCDLILGSRDVMLHVDWKFGAGVSIGAVYRDDDKLPARTDGAAPLAVGERVNAQLLFYLIGAMTGKLRRLYRKDKALTVAIVQPRAETPLSYVTVSRAELKWFREDLHFAVMTAMQRDPPRVRGEHCRWAPCRATCPLWYGPALDLSALEPVPAAAPPASAVRQAPEAYGIYLARAKALIDLVLGYRDEVETQMHAYLEAGGSVPGWKLKAKKKLRQWVDPDIVAKELAALGFTYDEIWAHRIVTFESADATARRRKVIIPEALRVAPLSTGTTLATADDPAPAVTVHTAREQLIASLRALQHQQQGA
jgi:hypothetical protein